MICFAALLGFLLVLRAEAGVGSSEGSVCNETPQCLLFKPICKSQNFEVRHYDPVKWVCTSFSSPTWMLGVGPAFWRMKNYLDENQIGWKTAPGFIEMPPDDPPQAENSQSSWVDKLKNLSKLLPKMREYTICFLLPMENQSNPPQPTNPKVKIVETGERYMYVRPYNDWVKGDAAESQVLFNSINMTSYEKSHFAVGYNSPMNPNPYSEVWVAADGVPHC